MAAMCQITKAGATPSQAVTLNGCFPRGIACDYLCAIVLIVTIIAAARAARKNRLSSYCRRRRRTRRRRRDRLLRRRLRESSTSQRPRYPRPRRVGVLVVARRPEPQFAAEAGLFRARQQRASSASRKAALDANAAVLKQRPTWTVTIEGHCDERGTADPIWLWAIGAPRRPSPTWIARHLRRPAEDRQLREGIPLRCRPR